MLEENIIARLQVIQRKQNWNATRVLCQTRELCSRCPCREVNPAAPIPFSQTFRRSVAEVGILIFSVALSGCSGDTADGDTVSEELGTCEDYKKGGAGKVSSAAPGQNAVPT